MAGYSEKTLLSKLGIKENYKIKIVHPPENYFQLVQMPNECTPVTGSAKADFIHCFLKTAKELNDQLPKLKACVEKNGMIWISWPKKASGIVTDINENIIRKCALSHGLVDIKVCAIDETWSGLKLVYRLKDR
jgi:hypothetical protein